MNMPCWKNHVRIVAGNLYGLHMLGNDAFQASMRTLCSKELVCVCMVQTWERKHKASVSMGMPCLKQP